MAAFSLLPMGSFCGPVISGGSHQSLDDMSYPVLAAQINTLFRVRLSTLQTVEFKLLKAPLAPPTPVTAGATVAGGCRIRKIFAHF